MASILLSFVLLLQLLLLCKCQTEWRPSDLSNFANASIKNSHFAIIDPDNILTNKEDIQEEISPFEANTSISFYLFIFDKITNFYNEKETYQKFANELFISFEKPSNVQDDNTLFIIYCKQIGMLELQGGKSLKFDKGEMIDLKLKYETQLNEGNYSLFKEIIQYIKIKHEQNTVNRIRFKWLILFSIIIGIIITGAIVMYLFMKKKAKREQVLLEMNFNYITADIDFDNIQITKANKAYSKYNMI